MRTNSEFRARDNEVKRSHLNTSRKTHHGQESRPKSLETRPLDLLIRPPLSLLYDIGREDFPIPPFMQGSGHESCPPLAPLLGRGHGSCPKLSHLSAHGYKGCPKLTFLNAYGQITCPFRPLRTDCGQESRPQSSDLYCSLSCVLWEPVIARTIVTCVRVLFDSYSDLL